MAEHTPTPWITQKCGELCPDDVMIVADMGIRDGIHHISTVAKALSMRQPADVTAANAAFIVTACNSHDALVSMLKRIMKYGELGCVDVGGYHPSGGKKPASKDVWQFPRHMLTDIEAALATAEPSEHPSQNGLTESPDQLVTTGDQP